MNVQRLRYLRGPNVWAACPVLEAVLDFGPRGPWTAEQVRQTLDRLGAAPLDPMPTTTEDGAAPLLGLARGFGLAALKLQQLAGHAVSFAAVRPTDRPDLFVAAVEFAEEAVGRLAAETASRLMRAAREDSPLPLEEEVRRLGDLAYDRLLPASTAAIYRAARGRGIPAARLSPEYGRYLRLGQGAKQHRCQASEPDTVSAVARHASTDKYLAKELLQAAGVPVPRGRLVATAEEAWVAACELGLPVAVKPQDSDLATGVSLDLRTREQVEAGFRCASEHSAWVLVEHFAPGMEHRVLVVGEQVVAVTRIEPPHVLGDGASTVAELVDRANRDPRRGVEGSGAPLRTIALDDVALAVLAAQGFSPASIPPAGERILLRRNPPYFKNGGNLIDLTDCIHPSTASHAVAAARAVQLPVAGLDVVALDIGRPLEEQGGVVVEINTSPGLWLHLAPWADSPRPVGEAIVASLFPPGNDGRIPVVALVGAAPGPATRQLTALLGRAGLRVGVAGASALVVGERRWAPEVHTPQERAALVLQNPDVDVALLETAPGDLVRAGFGSDRCDVAVVLEPGPVEDGPDEDGIALAPGAFLHALRHALAPQGFFVLPAEGEWAEVEASLPAEQILLVAQDGDVPSVSRHLAAGGRALLVQGDSLALAQGTAAPRLLGESPAGGTARETPGLLPALAAGLVLGLSAEALSAYLGSLP
jgi:cyanophycin synthetase